MNCSSNTAASCGVDRRREQVMAGGALCGLDEVEVLPDGKTLRARMFGKVPAGLGPRNLRIEGGDRIRGIQVTWAEFKADGDGDVCLHVGVDRRGDFSTYCLCLVNSVDIETQCGHDPLPPDPLVQVVPDGVDPRYACIEFGFRIDCPSPLDCRPVPCATESPIARPDIDYLARDFTSLRTLMFNRIATTMPAWRERHAADLGVTLVELLAYRADQLSYQLDAVATEAYLATARRRISVRRHARLVDYRLHEGCNARAWITIKSDVDIDLDLRDLVFACPPADNALAADGVIDWQVLQRSAGAILFEPMAWPGTYVEVPDLDANDPDTHDESAPMKRVVQIKAAHSAIHFYTWSFEACCLPEGSTRATLVDQSDPAVGGAPAVLQLLEGHCLILEEIRGAVTGAAADADRAKRHAVRLTRVQSTLDPLNGTRLLEVEWDRCDALPFALCLTARTAVPACELIEIAIARGNVLLVDHGVRIDEESDDWIVRVLQESGCCRCDGAVADIVREAATLRIMLARTQVTHAARLLYADRCASHACTHDPRQALPQVTLDVAVPDALAPDALPIAWRGSYAWQSVADLLSSSAGDTAFVAEVDDEGRACIRFGDGLAGKRPQAGWRFRARYRVGNGTLGNVGADSIVWIARRSGTITGAMLAPRNPMAACGGVDPEAVADAKRFAPNAYARKLERAVRAQDYALIAADDARIEGANSSLDWTGSWFEATVALDALAAFDNDASLSSSTLARLHGVRRIGHDVRIVPARRVSLRVALDLCVTSGYARAEVVRTVLDVLSNRVRPDGQLGLFHADRLVFGEDVAASRVIAAVQRVAGVSHVELTTFARVDADDALALLSRANGTVTIAADEIAQLDNDPDFPERGTLTLNARGGR